MKHEFISGAISGKCGCFMYLSASLTILIALIICLYTISYESYAILMLVVFLFSKIIQSENVSTAVKSIFQFAKNRIKEGWVHCCYLPKRNLCCFWMVRTSKRKFLSVHFETESANSENNVTMVSCLHTTFAKTFKLCDIGAHIGVFCMKESWTKQLISFGRSKIASIILSKSV